MRFIRSAAFLAATLLYCSVSFAQKQEVNCISSTSTPCSSSSHIGGGTQGDPAWQAFGKLNDWGLQLGLFTNQPANFVLATPNGSAGIVSPRALVNADFPTSGVTAGSYTGANITVNAQGIVTAAANGSGGGSLPSCVTNNLLYYAATGTSGSCLALGANLSISAGTLNAAATGATAFSALTSSTNTGAAMLVGTGASLGVTGAGTIGATSVPVAGVSGLGTGVSTFLATPSSANFAAAVTGETGSGAVVFATSPTLVTPNIGAATASGLTLSGITGLTQCLHVSTSGVVTGTGSDCGSGSGAVSSVTAGGSGDLTISPTSGAVVADLSTQSAGTVLANVTGSTATPTAVTMANLQAAMVSANATTISVTAPTGPTNDWSPAGWGTTVGVIYATPTAGGSTVDGLVAGSEKQVTLVCNAEAVGGSDNITLKNQSTSDTTAANRFAGPNDIILPPGGCKYVTYLGGSIARWATVQKGLVAADIPAALASTTSVNGTTISASAGTAPGSTGAFTLNDCVKVGSTSPLEIADTGAACGGGGGSGTVNSGTAGQLGFYSTTGTAISGTASASIATGALTLGASGTLGSVTMGNATSGTVTLAPVTGALGAVTASFPAVTGTVAELTGNQSFGGQQTFGSIVKSTFNPTASQSGLQISGAPFSGGTGTTTQPWLYFATGATAPTTFNTSGTFVGFNAQSGFAGNFLDFRVNGGASVALLDASGNLTVASCTGCGSGAAFSSLTGGTNATAAMVVGTGASLTTSGTGSIKATDSVPFVNSATSATSVTPDCSHNRELNKVVASATGTFTVNAPTGCTAVDGQEFKLKVTSPSGGTVTYSWNATFIGSATSAMPTTSNAASKEDYFGFLWDADKTKWVMLANNQGV